MSNIDGRNAWNAPEQIPGIIAQKQTDTSVPAARKVKRKTMMSRLSGSFASLAGLLQIIAVGVIIGGLCELGKRYWGTRRTHRKVM